MNINLKTSNMKANELMIGDLVHIAGFIEPRAHAITAIKPDDDGHYFALLDEDDVWWDITCLAPIQLTPEILENNGFKKLRISWILRDGYMGVSFQYMYGKWSIDIRNEFAPKDELGRCDLVSFARAWYNVMYVHELQHALRLCGIEKEIVL